MGIREEQKEIRKKVIMTAALDLFIRKGYAATKISDIAKQAGMSTGLMFHYFDSKENLYEELVRFGVLGPMSMLELSYREPIKFFEDSAKKIFEDLKNNPESAKMFVLMSQAFYHDGAPTGVKDLLKGFDIITPTVGIIIEGQRNMTIREGDPYALSVAFWCAIQGIAEQVALQTGMPCPDSSWVVDIIRRKK